MSIIAKARSVKILFMVGVVSILGSCAYYNTFYNANQYFLQGEKEFNALSDGKISVALRKKFDTAIEKANKVINQYPDSRWLDDSYFIIARSYYYKGDYRMARQVFEEFAHKFSSSELYDEAMVWYGRILWNLDERELAFFQWKKIMNRTDDMYLLAELYSSIGGLYFSDQAYDSALFYYKKATDVGKSYDIAAEAQYRVAEIDLARSKPKDAIKNLKKIDQFSPSLALRDKMQVLLTRIYRESGQYEEAIVLINEKLNDQANEKIWGDLELQLGLIYLAQNDIESAISRLKQVTEKYKGKPVEADASYQLAEIYMNNTHDYVLAAAEYDNVTRIEANTLRAFESRIRSSEIKRFNTIRNRLDNLAKTISEIDLNPVVATDSLQTEIEVSQDPEELKKELEKKDTAQRKSIDTLVVFKEYYSSLYEIAEIYYFNFNQPDSAVYYFERVVQEIPFNEMQDKALYSLYKIFMDLNDPEKAAEYTAELKQSFPESQYLAEIEKRQVVASTHEFEADSILIEAEKLDQVDQYQALILFEKLCRDYPDCNAAEKSVLNLAYIYHHKLFDLQNSLTWYKYYLDTYPQGEFYAKIKANYDQLKSLEDALAQDDQTADQESEKTEVQAESEAVE
ncbi:MAG: tetratricopeptide repeat protein [Candidatus Neomarinimicrobiota bacterium]|jgi:outer membrane protein assembly factor BamD (BamD/ComL family)